MSASTAQHHVSGGMLASLRLTWRWAALALASLSLSLIAASLPVDIGYHLTSDSNLSQSPHVIADIGESKAYADAVPVEGAIDLLKEYADAAGLQYGEFVAVVAALVTTSTGMVTGVADGIMLDSSLEKNLSNLVDAADYPEWSTLDSATQTQWGSQENYQAAKFNTLMNAFGFDDVAETYYDSFSADGGGSFELSEELKSRLTQIGRIGNRWSMGLGNSYQKLVSLLTNRQAIVSYFGSGDSGYVFDATGINDWPSDVPIRQVLGNGSVQIISTQNNRGNIYIATYKSDSVVWIWSTMGDTYVGSGSTSSVVYMMSRSPFMYGALRGEFNSTDIPDVQPTENAIHYSEVYDGQTYDYYLVGMDAGNLGFNVTSSTQPINRFNATRQHLLDAAKIMMRVDNFNSESNGPNLSGYPEDSPSPDEQIYFPPGGVTNNNTWNSYTTPTPVKQPENPFNPGNETSTDDWKDKTEASTVNLEGVHFEKLFPFCLLADIGLLFSKMQSLGILPQVNQTINGNGDLNTQGAVTDNASAYLHVKLPISSFDPGHDFIQDGEEVDFDLVPLHDLLIMVRPAVQILVVVVLLFTLIDFWRGVLAG